MSTRPNPSCAVSLTEHPFAPGCAPLLVKLQQPPFQTAVTRVCSLVKSDFVLSLHSLLLPPPPPPSLPLLCPFFVFFYSVGYCFLFISFHFQSYSLPCISGARNLGTRVLRLLCSLVGSEARGRRATFPWTDRLLFMRVWEHSHFPVHHKLRVERQLQSSRCFLQFPDLRV